MEDQDDQTLDIKRYLQMIHKRRYAFVIAAVVIMTAATVASYLLPKTYEASTTVSIEKNYLNSVLMRDIAVASPMDDLVQALSIVMTGRRNLTSVLAGLGVPVDPKTGAVSEKIIRHFQKNTKIRLESRSGRSDIDIFTVTYRDRDPQFARDYVNALVRQYVGESLSKKKDEALGANRFVYEQMELYKGKIDRVEAELERRKKQGNAQSLTRLAALKKKYDDMLTQYTDKHPDVVRLKAEIEAAQERLSHGQRSGGQDEGGGEGSATASAGGDRGMKNLERDRDAYKKIYESLVASLGRSEVSAQVETQNKADVFNVLEPAVLPVEPVSRPRWQIILMGLAAGIAGGTGVAIVLDMMDRTIKNVVSLKALGLPVLVAIPRIKNAAAMAAMKRKDRLLYGAAGAYVGGVVTLAVIEFLK